MSEPVRKCLHCGTPLPEKSRSDRKYCPYKFGIKDFCKNAVNNKDTLGEYHANKKLSKINSKNRDNLRELLGSLKECEVTLQQLIDAGVKINFSLNPATMTESGNPALLYIEFGLEQLGNNRYKIFRHGRQF